MCGGTLRGVAWHVWQSALPPLQIATRDCLVVDRQRPPPPPPTRGDGQGGYLSKSKATHLREERVGAVETAGLLCPGEGGVDAVMDEGPARQQRGPRGAADRVDVVVPQHGAPLGQGVDVGGGDLRGPVHRHVVVPEVIRQNKHDVGGAGLGSVDEGQGAERQPQPPWDRHAASDAPRHSNHWAEEQRRIRRGGGGTEKFVYQKWPDRIFPSVNSIAFGSAPRREAASQLDRPAVSQTETHTLGFFSVADTAPSSGEKNMSQNWRWPNGNAGVHSMAAAPPPASGHQDLNRQPKKLRLDALPFDRRRMWHTSVSHCLEPSQRKLLTPPPSKK